MHRSALHFCLLSSLAVSAAAQGYSTDFETFTAGAAGIPAAGQDGFYVGPVAGSLDGAIYTYAGNTLGIPVNPNGGTNFYCGVGTTGLVRAQRNVTLPTNGLLRVEYDVLGNYNGVATAPPNNLGGLSFQPSATSTYINMLFRWPTGAVTPPTTWNADYQAGPTAAGVSTVLPDPAFQGLAVNVWHRYGVTIDLGAGVYIDFRITNGVTNVTTVYTPPAPVPLPGTNPAPTTVATAFRLFTGNVGNVVAFDNLKITYAATYRTFGTGCAGSLGVPTLGAAPGSAPSIGTTMQVALGNLPLSLAVMATGFSNTVAAGSLPLPFSLAGSGFPGCDLLVDPLVTQFLIGSANAATWNFTIPLDNSFIGMTLYNQGVSLDTTAAGAAFSNGGSMIIGL